MSRIFLFLFIWLPSLICSGCTYGFLYTNSTVPLVKNMDNTPLGTKFVTINSKLIKEPITGIGVSAEWNSRAIGDAARRAGLTQINFADMHTFSILGGIWKKQTVKVWGE
ncbi:TRL domain-containing protein [Thermodesulfobacteriota bacterium]